MSSSVSGKFQDHYITLGVETKADSETIQAAYSVLAKKYHPDNRDTGDPVKFEAVTLAFEVLADPALRIEFDKIKGVDHEAGDPKFTGVDFFQHLQHSAVLRATILCLLYDRRRIRSFKPALSMRHLEAMLFVKAEALDFALWYLKKRSLVVSDDKSALQITVDGMDFLEQNRPSPEAILAMIKPTALVVTQPQPAAVAETKAETKTVEQPAAETPVPETPLAETRAADGKAAEPVLSVLGVLNRAIQRTSAPEEVPAATK
jgi:curved DNA-binding protein